MTSSQRILTILAIVLLAFLAGLTVWANWVPAPPVLAVLPLIPLTAVLILAAMFGRLAALCGGLVYGLAVTLVLLPDHLSVLPLSREFGAALLQPLALANYLAAPLLGFLAGSGARLRQARQRQLRRKIDELSRANQDMRSHIADHERTLATLSQSRLYKKAWTDLIDESGESESLIGLFLTVLLNQRRRRRHAGLIAPDATPPCRDITFSHLIDLTCPDILAVLQLDGTIHAVNARLFAIFCYPADTPLIGRSVTDLLVPEDAPRALANIARAVGSDFDSGETYDIRASDGRFQTLVVSPHVYLECLGDPLVLALRVASSQGSAADKPEPARPDPIALAELQVWCLSADRLTLYISPDLAGRLSESAALMLGKPIDHYLIRKQAARFHDFMASCQDGQSHTIDLVMRPHKGDRTILSLTAWPAIGAQGHLLGLTLLARDITERRIVEEALQHRLAIEQMISAFSTRFISIKADAMDQEIREVVRRIGAFEEAIETTVEIYRSGKISQPVRLTVKHMQPAGQAQADKQEQETVSVPIIIDDEPLGHFSFSVAKYRSGWLDNDLELIRLAGEIIINSLIRKQNELALSINENRLATTLQSIGDAVIATDTAGRIIIINRTAEQLTGWSEQEILHRPITEVFRVAGQDNQTEDTTREIHPLTETDDSLVLTDRNGRQIFVAVSRAVIQDEAGAVFGEVVVFRDVTQKKKEIDEIRYISFHDRLTGLYNRAFFEEELTRLNTPRQFPITIILGDCNGLKIANDIFGHLEGDKLLQTIAGILRKATRKEDIVARWGGDEFAIILPRTNETAASAIRERILSLCDAADPYPILPSLALGSATNNDGSDDLLALLKLAEDRMYRHKLMEGKSARNAILKSIEKMIYEKSNETEEHAVRMIEISDKIGRAVGLSDDEQEELSLLAILHDMGKVGIPDSILSKNGHLDDSEWEIMKKHPEKGYNIARSTPELTGIAQYILHHHERWDGSGYPDGLSGNKIPRLARILSIIDAYDVITHSRPYKSAQSNQDALAEINRCAGTQFDPELSRVFVEIMRQEDTGSPDSGAEAVKDGIEAANPGQIDAPELGDRAAK